jgi:hypothetical protein
MNCGCQSTGLGLLAALLWLGHAELQGQSVLISEFMAANTGGVHDQDGETSDWIELFNTSSNAVDLAGWALSDNRSEPQKWIFPPRLLEPQKFLIVFASGKNLRTATGELHTNFKLDAAGEFLSLMQPDGVTYASIFWPAFPAQTNGVSYGYRMDGGAMLTNAAVYMTPTPGEANWLGGFSGIAEDVQFLREGGTFVEPFTLTLQTYRSNAVIHYLLITNFGLAITTLTNQPTINSPVYSGPLPISGTTEVRAQAFEPGRLPGPIATVAFIQIAPDLAEFTSDIPLVIINTFGVPIGLDTDQAAQMMLFDTGAGRASLLNPPALQTRMGISQRGSSSQATPKASWNVEFWNDAGDERALPVLDLPADSDWVLYGSTGFDPSHMHNSIFHWFGRQVGRYSSRTRYVEVFRKTNSGPVTTNDYFGLYLLLEKPKRSPDRVAMAELAPGHTNALEVTGGYLLKIDRQNPGEINFPMATIPTPFGTVGGQSPIFVSPRLTPPDLNDPRRQAQQRWIRDYMNAFVTNLSSANWADPLSGYRAYVDVPSWIDNLLVNIICFNVDSYRFNTYFFKDRGAKLEQGPPWDCDRCLGTGGGPSLDIRPWNPRVWRTYASDLVNDQGTDFFGRSAIGINWFNVLFRDPDFWQAFIDRYQTLRQGTFSNQAVLDMVEGFYQQIKEAQVREQDRWAVRQRVVWPRFGSNSVTTSTTSGSNTYSSTYSFDFGPTNNIGGSFGYFTNEVNFQKRWLLDRLDFIDTNFLGLPKLDLAPSPTLDGTALTVQPATEPGTFLYYTLNGVDPRLPGGAISPSALSNAGPLTLNLTNNIRLLVRCFNASHANLTNAIPLGNPLINSFWSGPVEALYVVRAPPLRLTELMYHPAGGEAFEFIEFQNISSNQLNLAGFHLEGVAQFAFPELTLEGGQACVLVRNPDAFQSRYGTNQLIIGALLASLPDNEGRLVLAGPLGEPIQDFTYHDDWYPVTDGPGFSLVPANPLETQTNWDSAEAWRPAGSDDGTPGQPDPGRLPQVTGVLINELLSNPEPPFEDAIELYNPNPTAVDISFWYVTDDFTQPKKFQIPPGTIIAPFGYQAFDEHAFNPFNEPPLPTAFSFRDAGDEAYMFSADSAGRLTGYWHGFRFGPAEPNVSFGRHLNSVSSEYFVPQLARSFRAANAGPKIGPIVISELQYHPPNRWVAGRSQEYTQLEFVELQNSSDRPVPLFETNNPQNTWRLTGSIRHQFAPGITLPAGACILVVPFDPASQPAQLATFRSHYSVPVEQPIIGPYQGNLPNASGVVELCQPLPQGTNSLLPDWPCFVVDAVHYSKASPWPVIAEGSGPTLQRVSSSAFGSEPTNWVAAAPTAGLPHVSMGAAPTIAQQPLDLVRAQGQPAEFTVAVDGHPPLFYQWRFNGENIVGATARNLLLPVTRFDQAGSYTVVVFDASGAIESAPARLTVVPGISIQEHPRAVSLRGSTNTADYGFTTNSVTFSVLANSPRPMRFQWRFNGTPILNQNGPSLTLTNVGLADDGDYDVLVFDDVSSLKSRAAHLTVLLSPTVLIAPTDQWVPSNGSFTATTVLRGNPPPFQVQWREVSTIRADLMVTNPTNIFSFGPVTNPAPRQWRLVVSNAANPSPSLVARFNVSALTDADQDELPDDWEAQFGLDAANPADRNQDADGDGLTNYEEYIAGTDPTNPASYLRIERIIASGVAQLQLGALSNRSYTVQYIDRLGPGPWTTLLQIPARPIDHVETIIDPIWTSNRFYQLVTPARSR